MISAIKAADLMLPGRHPKDWVVDRKSVGSGEKAMIYPGRYLYRGIIREQDIFASDNGRVRFRYRNANTSRAEERLLVGAAFL